MVVMVQMHGVLAVVVVPCHRGEELRVHQLVPERRVMVLFINVKLGVRGVLSDVFARLAVLARHLRRAVGPERFSRRADRSKRRRDAQISIRDNNLSCKRTCSPHRGAEPARQAVQSGRKHERHFHAPVLVFLEHALKGSPVELHLGCACLFFALHLLMLLIVCVPLQLRGQCLIFVVQRRVVGHHVCYCLCKDVCLLRSDGLFRRRGNARRVFAKRPVRFALGCLHL
mmetsp:Transcript_76559/g.115229  ORF Transcript_76559/g.115229 Transcript_76559/m.115229 type:complete len:228 (-) Transcript_76559:124-807(-)